MRVCGCWKNTFVVSSGEVDFDRTADSLGYAYICVTGDFTVTDRLMDVTWAEYWMDKVGIIHFATVAGTYTLLKAVIKTSYSDISVSNGSSYFQTISAVNAIGEGTLSSAIGVTLPTKLTETSIGTTGSFGNVSMTTNAAAMDGNLITFF